jgi:hypothetical protein
MCAESLAFSVYPVLIFPAKSCIRLSSFFQRRLKLLVRVVGCILLVKKIVKIVDGCILLVKKIVKIVVGCITS